jgi:HAMP domain-containing protein
MSLDGLRAWIGLVERKLTMRTRVFLVLVAIAVGGAAVGIYLAVEAQNEAVTQDDLQAVRDELAGGTATATPELSQLESELEALRNEVASLRAEGEAGGTGGVSPEGSGGAHGNGANNSGSESGGGANAPPNHQQLQEEGEAAIEHAK